MRLTLIKILFMLSASSYLSSARASVRHSHLGEVRIKMHQAIELAQSKNKGKLVDSTLESINEVPMYHMSFINQDHTQSELFIDASNGKVIEKNKLTSKLQ